MTYKTRKHIWPVALMSLAVFGVLATVVALSVVQAQVAQADGCDTGTPAERSQCDTDHEQAGLDHTDADHDHMEPSNGDTGMMPDRMHASAPGHFWLEGLDNSARLNWTKPYNTDAGATVVGYRINRDAWHTDDDHPVNEHGDAHIDIYPSNVLAASHNDRGLAYNTVYVYTVQAIVEYDVAHWWNALNCVMMNDVVKPAEGEPAVGADDMTSPYCAMYAGLSEAAKVVVHRAYDAQEGKYPGMSSYYRYAVGEMSMMRSIETSVSGGLLDALTSPPSPPQNVMTDPSCDDSITVSWEAPADAGQVPADFPGCGACSNRTPVHQGGTHAGIEIATVDATITGYRIERRAGNGAWMMLGSSTTTTYTDTSSLTYGATYQYRVTAVNDIGLHSDPSAPGTITLTEPVAAQVPTSPDADPSPDNPAEVLFTWDPPGTAAGNAVWRTVDDVGANNMSESMSYEIQRQRVGTTTWMTLPMAGATQRHQYLESAATAADAIDNIQTQEFVDENVPATGAYKYRVRAIIDLCEPSEWAVTAEEVTVRLELGNASGLSASASSVPGIVNLSWNVAPNASVHWLAGIKQADWDAGNYSNIIWTQTSSMNSHVVSGLDSGDEYVFTVIGGTSLNGPWSSWTPLMRVTPN